MTVEMGLRSLIESNISNSVAKLLVPPYERYGGLTKPSGRLLQSVIALRHTQICLAACTGPMILPLAGWNSQCVIVSLYKRARFRLMLQRQKIAKRHEFGSVNCDI